MTFPKLSWGREKHDLANRWPKGPDGTPEKPAFPCRLDRGGQRRGHDR